MSDSAEQTFGPSPSLPKATAVLRCSCEDNPTSREQTVYIVGTSHVSTSSCEDVASVIQQVKPEIVMVELCMERRSILSLDKSKFKAVGLHETIAAWRAGRISLIEALLGGLMERAAAHLDVLPGEEFRVALREAHATGAKVVLGDRLLSVTLARIWASLSHWERVHMVFSILLGTLSLPDPEELRGQLEEMRQDTDLLTEAVRELGKTFPGVVAPLIEERDMYMVHMLHRITSRASTVVAVVGAGHMAGITARWNDDINVDELMAMPVKRRASRIWRHFMYIATSGLIITTAIALTRRVR